MTARPRRPSQEEYDRALALYRANATPESIAERTGLTEEQVDRAMYEGWPPTRGSSPKPALRAWEHEIDDRLHRARLASIDWAQANAEASSLHAKDFGSTVKVAGSIKQAILRAHAAHVKSKIEAAARDGKPPKVEDLVLGHAALRTLTTMHRLMDPAQQAKIADVYRFMRGDEDDETGDEHERALAGLDGLSDEELKHYGETGERPVPEQKVLKFPTAESG